MKEAANINANQDDITVGVTFFADLTAEEKAAYHGANFTTQHGEVQESVEEAAPAFWGSVSHKHHYGPIKQQGILYQYLNLSLLIMRCYCHCFKPS